MEKFAPDSGEEGVSGEKGVSGEEGVSGGGRLVKVGDENSRR
jgi:hypothetical protein